MASLRLPELISEGIANFIKRFAKVIGIIVVAALIVLAFYLGRLREVKR